MSGITIQTPNITAGNDRERLQQIQSYLYQMAQQLQWAFSTIQTGNGSGYVVNQNAPKETNGDGQDSGAAARFNEVKALIIKSADIVNAYYEKINARLAGEYVAQSDFGTYTELTEQQIKANSTAIEQHYAHLQGILTDIENLEHSLIETNAYINSGLLYYDDGGAPVYGLEIGQRNEINGVEVFNQYARFTPQKLSFYDSNGIEVAYISDMKLYISHIEVTGSFYQGGFEETTLEDKSVVTRWVGGGN